MLRLPIAFFALSLAIPAPAQSADNLTREPQDRALIPVTLRTALGVPVLAVWNKRLTDMQPRPAPAK